MVSVNRFSRRPACRVLVLITLHLAALAGCGLNPKLTTAQQEKDAALRMAWVDKAIQVAEQHGLAYRVEVNSTGRPSIGESVDLYLDTGLNARIIMFGNGASGREPVDPPAVKP